MKTILFLVLSFLAFGCSSAVDTSETDAESEPETYEVEETHSGFGAGKVTAAAVCEPGDVLLDGGCQVWGNGAYLTNDAASPVQDHENGGTVDGWVCGAINPKQGLRLRAHAVCEVVE